MSDGEILLLIFAAVYVADCFLWDSRAAVAFVSRWKKRWRMRRPGDGFGNDRGGVLLKWPLPPLGTAFVVTPPEVVFAPGGLTKISVESPNPGVRVPQQHRFLAWDAIESVQWEERDVFVNGRKFAKCAVPADAAVLAKRIKKLSTMEAEERIAEIRRGLRGALRTDRVKSLLALFFKGTGGLRFVCILLMLVSFVVLPLVYNWWGEERPTFMVLLMMLVLMIQGTAETFCLHRKFFRKSRGERWTQMIVQFLLPQHNMRALDFLSRRYLQRFHPLAVASVLLKERDFQEYAGGYYRDLLHPVPFHDADHEAARQAMKYRDEILLPEMEVFLRAQGIDLAAEVAPCADIEEEAKSYCPRCRSAFIIDHAICNECGEKPTIPVPN